MSTNLAWFYIVIAGFMEPIWVYLFHKSDGGTKIIPTVSALLVIALSFMFFTFSLRGISINTAYVVWVGIGALSVAIMGFIVEDVLTFQKFLFISMILTGVVGLRYFQ